MGLFNGKHMIRIKFSNTLIFFVMLMSCVITLVNIGMSSIETTRKEAQYQMYGSWSHMSSDLETVTQREFHALSTLSVIGKDNQELLVSFDGEMFQLSRLRLSRGRKPIDSHELIMDENTFTKRGYALSDLPLNVNIPLNNTTVSFNVVGTYQLNTDLWSLPENVLESSPKMITTGMHSNDVLTFGVANPLKPNSNQNIITNSYAYPVLDVENADVRDHALQRIASQKTLRLQAVVLVVVFGAIIALGMLLNQSRHVKITIMKYRLLGMNRIESIKLLRNEGFRLGLLSVVSTVTIVALSFGLFQLFPQGFVFDVSVSLMLISQCVFVCIIMLLIFITQGSSVYAPLVGGLVIPTRRSLVIKLILRNSAMMLTVCCLTVILALSTLQAFKIEMPNYRELVHNVIPQNANYKIMGIHKVQDGVYLSDYCNDTHSFQNCGLDQSTLDALGTYEEVDMVFAADSTYFKEFKNDNEDSMPGHGIYTLVLDEENMLKLFSNLEGLDLNRFNEGTLLFVFDFETESTHRLLSDSDRVSLTDRNVDFEVQKLFKHSEVDFKIPIELDGEGPFFLMSVDGASRLGYRSHGFKNVFVQSKKLHNYRLLDEKISSLTKGASMTNNRLFAETRLNDIQIQFLSSFGTLCLIILLAGSIYAHVVGASVKAQAPSVQLKRILGASKRDIFNTLMLREIVPGIIGLLCSFLILWRQVPLLFYDHYLKHVAPEVVEVLNVKQFLQTLNPKALSWSGSLMYIVMVQCLIFLALMIINIFMMRRVVDKDLVLNIAKDGDTREY